jgi:hypothetical protein
MGTITVMALKHCDECALVESIWVTPHAERQAGTGKERGPALPSMEVCATQRPGETHFLSAMPERADDLVE